MTPSKKVWKALAELNDKLPPRCVVRKRKGYAIVYFIVPEKIRPPGWNPSYIVGRTDQHTALDIIKRGHEYHADLKAARKAADLKLPRTPDGSLTHVIKLYKDSEHYLNLKPATRKGYISYLRTIQRWSEESGNPHIRELTLPTAVEFLDLWKDAPRTRKYYKALLSKLYQIAMIKGLVSANLMAGVKLPKTNTDKFYKVWRREHIDRFVKAAHDLGLPNVARAVIIAWEGTRQTDILNMTEPFHYYKGHFKFRTSKTGEVINCAAAPETVRAIKTRPAGQQFLTVNDVTGEQWTVDAFSNQFGKARQRAGLDGYQFRKIRNSAAIEGLKADLTDAQFMQRFGWSKNTVEFERDFYTDIDQEIMEAADKKILDMKKRAGREKS